MDISRNSKDTLIIKIAYKSTGDGDCLFDDLQIILCWKESMLVELKYKCCLEMVSHGKKIQQYIG